MSKKNKRPSRLELLTGHIKKTRKARRATTNKAFWSKYAESMKGTDHKTDEEALSSVAGSGYSNTIDNINWKKAENEEHEQREQVAAKEIEEKRKRVGIAYNKGGYVYLTDNTDAETLGKK